MMYFLSLLNLFSIFVDVSSASTVPKPSHKVLLVSMDGFRYDYLNKTDTPFFDSMVEDGVTMAYVNNTFETNTFPSHYTIATGLYTENHGIVANNMYDPKFEDVFHMSNTEARWWSGGEPIWTTAEKAGIRTGTYLFPGTQSEHDGIRPHHWLPYNQSIPFEERVRTTVTWLADEDLDFCVLYFHEPDETGHDFGPDSEEVVKVIQRMDTMVGLLYEELEKAGIKNETNVIITSDHGMAPIFLKNQTIDISDYVNSSLLHLLVDQGTTASMWAQPGQAKALQASLAGVEHMTVWLKEDIPERYHMRNHRRVPDVFALADLGWTITDNATRRQAEILNGDHGYDNNIDLMKPFFVAQGPDFKSGQIVDPIRNTDIYPLICHLLGLEPAPNNGSLERALTLLRKSSDDGDDDGGDDDGGGGGGGAGTHPGVIFAAVLTSVFLVIIVGFGIYKLALPRKREAEVDYTIL